MGMEVWDVISDFRSRIEVLGSWDFRVMSSGGLRRDLREMVRLRSWPGASFCFLGRGLGILGRIYCHTN